MSDTRIMDNIDMGQLLDDVVRKQWDEACRLEPEMVEYESLDAFQKYTAKAEMFPGVQAVVEVAIPHIRRALDLHRFDALVSAEEWAGDGDE